MFTSGSSANIPMKSNLEERKMFSNIGGKIKGLAKFICWVGIISSVVAGIVLIISSHNSNGYYSYTDTNMIIAGILVMLFGSILSWIGSFVLYGFGELVDNSSKLVELKQNED